MSQTRERTFPPTAPSSENLTTPGRRLWQVAGGFALAHVVLIAIGIGMQNGPRFEQGTEGIREGYVDGDASLIIAGGMVETLGYVLLLPALVFIARAIGRSTEVGRWAAQTALLAAVGYITVTLAVGFPAGGAALHSAQRGLDLETAFAINNIRIFGYFLSLSLLGVHAIGLAIAAREDRIMTRWLGWGGLLTGTVLVASVPAASIGQQDWGTLVWLVWWVGVAVCLVRYRPATD